MWLHGLATFDASALLLSSPICPWICPSYIPCNLRTSQMRFPGKGETKGTQSSESDKDSLSSLDLSVTGFPFLVTGV